MNSNFSNSFSVFIKTMSGWIQDGLKLLASEEEQKLRGAKITLHTITQYQDD